MDRFKRTQAIIGEKALEKLKTKTIAVFGLGGVGSYCAEALVRGGIGKFVFVDNDFIEPSNINRQLLALEKNIGKKKVELMRERALEINSTVEVDLVYTFFSEQTRGEIDFSRVDYIIDAIDTISSKILLAQIAQSLSIPIISCMGTGNKLDPTFKVADIYSTQVCPLAKVMRRELKKRGVLALKTVYSEEEPHNGVVNDSPSGRHCPGSISFVPPVAGFIMAGEVIKDLLNLI